MGPIPKGRTIITVFVYHFSPSVQDRQPAILIRADTYYFEYIIDTITVRCKHIRNSDFAVNYVKTQVTCSVRAWCHSRNSNFNLITVIWYKALKFQGINMNFTAINLAKQIKRILPV